MPIPRYSQVQKIMKRVFYSPKGAITIYTEDNADSKVFYEILLRRLTSEKVVINDVIPLGPKSEVIERSIESQNSKIPSLFIVDGDIKLMYGQKLETKNLIALDRYCIENYLCCEEGVISYLKVMTGKNDEDLEKELEFSKIILSDTGNLLNLYHRYAVAHKLDCACKRKHAQDLFNSQGPPTQFDDVKIEAEITRVDDIIKAKLKDNRIEDIQAVFQELIEEINLKNPKNIPTMIKVISGKSHLLPLIKLKISAIVKESNTFKDPQLKRLLAERICLDPLVKIREKILSIAA